MPAGAVPQDVERKGTTAKKAGAAGAVPADAGPVPRERLGVRRGEGPENARNTCERENG